MGWVGLGGGVRPDNDLRSFVNKQTILVKGFSDIRAQRGGERGSLCRRGGGGAGRGEGEREVHPDPIPGEGGFLHLQVKSTTPDTLEIVKK